jgi:SSS family solute:Na+ symporter
MVSFSSLDIVIIIAFFSIVLAAGYFFGRKSTNQAEDYLLSGRKVGLFLFVLTNVSTWYGGILGVGEFTYRYGIVSWFTQGFPYYIFAILFALLFAKKIREASLFTIPDKLTEVYGRKAGIISAIFIFILVSPAPYLLMTANLISLIFNLNILISLIISLIISFAYLFKGGYRSDLYTDAIQFFVMFGGFILIFIFSFNSLGGFNFLTQNLPAGHLKITGNASPTFIIVWFLIALWTFADPGFHQRCYAAKDGNTAVKGIIISIFFWALFDFLTTSTGLFARALLPGITQPVQAYPLLAEHILSPGVKGLFYAGMFATIISTSNSFFFLSATTIGRDFIFKLSPVKNHSKLKSYTITGLIISGIVSVLLAYFIPSVIELWYTIGSICIPGMILPVISSYYKKLKIDSNLLFVEMIIAVLVSVTWYFLREGFKDINIVYDIEPMIAGLTSAVLIHLFGLMKRQHLSSF